MADIVYIPNQEASLYMWDENKAIANWKKHKVTFETAVRVFSDKNAVVLPDIRHSDFEERKRIIGTVLDVISHVRILFVVYQRTSRNPLASAMGMNALEYNFIS